jgi:hypothetical protein
MINNPRIALNKYQKAWSFTLLDYLIVLLLFQTGWFIILSGLRRFDLILVIPVFLVFYKRYSTLRFDIKIFLVFIVYLVLAFFQGLLWGFSIISLITSFLLGFVVPYYIFILFGRNFFTLLEKIIFYLTIISFMIWLCHQFIPGAKSIIVNIINILNFKNELDVKRSMFFYTYWEALDQNFGLSRNAGFASEPGAYAMFITYAIIINYIRNGILFTKRNIFYIMVIITTFSTAGYISLGVLSLLLISQKKARIMGFILFSIFLFIAYYSYTDLAFMESKIRTQIAEQTGKELVKTPSGRITGARKSINVILTHPLFGRGLLAITKPDDASDPEFADYGWLSNMSRYGLIFGMLFMYYFLKGFYKFVKSNRLGLFEFGICALAIMIHLSSQVGISNFYFMIFFFIGLYKKSIFLGNMIKINAIKEETYRCF